MTSLPQLDLVVLSTAIREGAVAFRARTRLEPAGGAGDKVFPPTYLPNSYDGNRTRYAFEKRRIDGQDVPTVLLDSVASQANRMEEALRASWESGELAIPVISVDFSDQEGLEDLGLITALDAPHRAADALLRDSLLDGAFFRHSAVGRAITDARGNHATALYTYCPTALVFGMWDSTGPKGGLGSKYQRALTSEIIGIGAVAGVKVGSRIDPTGIEKNAGPLLAKAGEPGEWTVDPDEAEQKKGKPVPFGRKGSKGKGAGAPSEANHGNIPPALDSEAGGVTIDYALQTQVLSLPALRRLAFRTRPDGSLLATGERAEAQMTARTALAALGLAAMALARSYGYDLRSRSQLVPTQPLVFELRGNDGAEPERFELTLQGALDLVRQAARAAEAAGMAWHQDEIRLVPSPKLVGLITKSRAQVAEGDIAETD
jgi:CRISPR-associated protein Csb1